MADEETNDEDMNDEETIDEETVDEETVDEETVDEETVDEETVDEGANDDGMYEIVCSKCGSDAEIPFEPREDSAVYCQECYEADKRERRRREKNAPRKKHDTRVSLQITCAECGKEAELDYMPRGKPIDKVKCPECFEKEDADERWKEVHQHKKFEQTDEWSFECAECGRTDVIQHRPKPNKDYLCTRCFYDHAQPSRERVEQTEPVADGVRIRKKDRNDEG